MTNICDECDDRALLFHYRATRAEIRLEIERREADPKTMRLKWPRGFVDGLKWALEKLEEK